MNRDPSLQQDLELFRRFLQAINAPESHSPIDAPAAAYRISHHRRDLDEEVFVEEDDEEETEDEAGEGEDDGYEKDRHDGGNSEQEEEDDEDEDDIFDYYHEPAVSLQAPLIEQRPPPLNLFPKSPSRPEPGGNGLEDADLRCWEHGCNGRKFTTRSNLKRHALEKARTRPEGIIAPGADCRLCISVQN